MGGADFILLINMTVSGLFALTFLGIAIYVPHNRAAPIFSCGFLFAALYFLSELAMPTIPDQRIGYILGYAAYLMTLACLVSGLSRMYARPTPRPLLAVLVPVSLCLAWAVYDSARVTLIGGLLYQLPFFLLMLLAARAPIRAPAKTFIDVLMATVFSVAAAHFILKPALAHFDGGPGALPVDYGRTVYALIGQSVGAALSVAVGLMLLLGLIRQVVADMIQRSETDQLSALLNRRGFEMKAQLAMDRARRQRQPLTLMVCDIDFFKAINDTHGHMQGDRVIAAFAAELQKAATAHDGLAARLGGEEFAALLPGCTVRAAWRFAERVRLAAAAMAVPGLAATIRFTVSFGVAEMEFDDLYPDLYRRADGALYEAKKEGRDCVRAAAPLMIDEDASEPRLVRG